MQSHSRHLIPFFPPIQRSSRQFSWQSARLWLVAICLQCMSLLVAMPAAADGAIGHIASGGMQLSSTPLRGGNGGYTTHWSDLQIDTSICRGYSQCLSERAFQIEPLRLNVAGAGTTPTYQTITIKTGPELSVDANDILSTIFVNDTPFTRTLEVTNVGSLYFANLPIPEPAT